MAVDHRAHADRVVRAERPAEDRAQVVLELARDRALDRPVTRVVHARRHLVREQLAADLEQLDGEHADVVEVVEERRATYPAAADWSASSTSGAGAIDTRRIPPSWWFSTSGQTCTCPSRPRTASTDSSRSNGTNASRTSGPPARAPPMPGSTSAVVAQDRLPLAVVAAPPRLQDRGQPDRLRPRAEVVDGRRPRRTGNTGMPSRRNVVLLDQPVLRCLERGGRRVAPAGRVPAETGPRSRARLPTRTSRRRRPATVASSAASSPSAPTTSSPTGRAGAAGGIEETEPQAERDAGQPQHPPELPAPEHRDDGSGPAGRPWIPSRDGKPVSGMARTGVRCRTRQRRRAHRPTRSWAAAATPLLLSDHDPARGAARGAMEHDRRPLLAPVRRRRPRCLWHRLRGPRRRAARREIVDLALTGLACVRHRQAVAADGLSGDGAGLLTPIPRAFFARVARQRARDERSTPDRLGVVSAFLDRDDDEARRAAESAVADALRRRGARRSSAGATCRSRGAARRPGPRHCPGVPSGDPAAPDDVEMREAERAAYRARRRGRAPVPRGSTWRSPSRASRSRR